MAEKIGEETAIERIEEAVKAGSQELNLSRLKLITLPSELWELKNLISLDLSSNELTSLPSEIGQLRSLTSLDLGYNKITTLPKEIGQLVNLISFWIHRNRIGYLQREIGLLTNLERLEIGDFLGGNHFEFLPAEIGNLKKLRVLDLTRVGLLQLPSEIGLLTNLEKIILRRNSLSNLPAEIGLLKKLKVLDVSNQTEQGHFVEGENQISHIPFTIKNLTNLEILNLGGNPLSIPPEILEKSDEPQAIINFCESLGILSRSMKDLIKEKVGDEIDILIESLPKQIGASKRQVLEAKLLVVGQGGVGKTSTVNLITGNQFKSDERKTDGIDILHWKIAIRFEEVDSNKPIDKNDISSLLVLPQVDMNYAINIWDFGGQEIMHATHQFFLTKRSLYLLVLDSRLTQEENRVEYWLKIIQSFSDESPVLIVGNKTDQHPLDIDRTGLQKKYPNIVGILETSAATGAGIEELKAAIAKQVNNLPHVRDLLPETWFTVKTKLEGLGKQSNFITHDKYLELCAENEVSDETSQRTLIGFLHDLGVVLHFQDDPRLEALGILNPQWVTNGVYKILNSHTLFQNKGVLTISVLDEILNLPEYPRGKRLFIVDMMKKFELCYDIEADKSFLVPDLLPKDQPDLNFNGIPAFEYAYPVLPSSVITRFIVRMNQKIDDGFVWRTGVVLKIGDNKALVKADIEDRRITIAIDGMEHTRRDALLAVCTHLDEIHDSIKGLNPEKLIPVPGAVNAKPLSYNYLLMLEAKGVEVLPVPDGNSLIDVNIRKVLSGVPNEIRPKEGASNVTTIYNVNTGGGDFTGGDKSISAGDSSVVVGGNMSGNLISGNYNKINSAEISSELKDTLLQLGEAVDAMIQKLPAEQAAEVAEDFGKLADEAVKPKPNQKWYSVSIEGLIKAAENLDKLGTPVISLSWKVLSLLTGGTTS